MIRGGELRYTAKFKSPTVNTVQGDTTLDPRVEDFERRVGLQPLGASESTVGDQVQAMRMSLLTMRYDPRVNQRMTIFARGRTFEIMGIIVLDERDREMQLTCRELV